jgi:DNA-binding MarR family transcriptional regulator
LFPAQQEAGRRCPAGRGFATVGLWHAQPPAGADRADSAGGAAAPERPVPHLSEDELLAWRGLLELEARVLTVLDTELREKRDLSVGEFDALYQLWIQPGSSCRMKDLASRLLVSRGGATKLIIRLEKRGLVRRVTQAGLQAVTAELTEAGEVALTDAMDTHFDGVRRLVISRLEPGELAVLRRIAERLREAPG